MIVYVGPDGRKCDASCYDAKRVGCHCACGGKNHGMGLDYALGGHAMKDPLDTVEQSLEDEDNEDSEDIEDDDDVDTEDADPDLDFLDDDDDDEVCPACQHVQEVGLGNCEECGASMSAEVEDDEE